MNHEKISSVLKELHKISGFRISIHNTDFKEIVAYPTVKQGFCAKIHELSESELSACLSCDSEACKKVLISGETVIYKCRHGLVEAVSPLYSFGALTGFLMMGQILADNDSSENAMRTLVELGEGIAEAKALVDGIPRVSSDMIKSFVNIMTVCASYLTLSNAVTGAKATIGQLARQYIAEHFTERITIKDICDAIGYSKSSVLSSFKREFSVTVNAYLNNMRLERARKMLENENLTINEIALGCGFSDQSYFSKVFSAKFGITPSDFRKDEKE